MGNLAVDGSWVYWTNTRSVQRVPKSGGDVEIVIAGATAFAIALDASNVFFTNCLAATGTVNRVAKTGGAAAVLASALDGPEAIAVHDGNVYFTTYRDARSSIMMVPATGGAPVVLASGTDHPGDIAADATGVYVSNFTPGGARGGITRFPLGGGPPTVIASAENWPVRVAADGTGVYWTTEYSWRSKTGGELRQLRPKRPVRTLHRGRFEFFDLATEHGEVFWSSTDRHAIMHLVPGGAPTALATRQAAPQFIAIDAAAIYWNRRDRKIMKVAR